VCATSSKFPPSSPSRCSFNTLAFFGTLPPVRPPFAVQLDDPLVSHRLDSTILSLRRTCLPITDQLCDPLTQIFRAPELRVPDRFSSFSFVFAISVPALQRGGKRYTSCHRRVVPFRFALFSVPPFRLNSLGYRPPKKSIFPREEEIPRPFCMRSYFSFPFTPLRFFLTPCCPCLKEEPTFLSSRILSSHNERLQALFFPFPPEHGFHFLFSFR